MNMHRAAFTSTRISAQRSRLALALSLLTPALFAGPAGHAAEGSSGLGLMIEEVVVTARKREENLQDTPISISAYSGENLQARGITKLNDIQTLTPNLTFYNYTTQGASTNNASVFIRGVGQADFAPTAESGVGLYVDGVYYGRSVGSTLDLIDLERIEVLRGPQGTLFGRNTIGGALNISTKKPHDQFEGRVEATTGTDGKAEVALFMNVPLANNLYSNFSVMHKQQDGYVTKTTTGQDLGDTDTSGARVGLLWQPTDALEVRLAADYSTSDQNGLPSVFDGVIFDDGSVSGTVNSAYAHNVLDGINGSGLNACDATPANPAGSLDNPACLNDQYRGSNSGNGEDFSDTDTWGVALTIEQTINERLTFKSITAYRNLDAHFANDADLTSVPVNDKIEDILKQEQVSQEFQLLGSYDKVDWILGLYYFQEDGANINPVSFYLGPGGATNILSGGDFDNDSKAAFAQATTHVTDKLDVTVGVRWTEDTKRFTPNQYVTSFAFPQPWPVFFRLVPLQEYEETFDAVTPMLNVAYDLTDGLMLYATYAEGFKSGGFTQRLSGPFLALPSFGPEEVESYELGLKYASEDGSLTANLAAFYMDYSDIQINVFLGIAPTLDNAGSATVQGGELELKWMLAEGWLLETAAGYTDAGYDEVDPTTILTGDEDFALTPEWTGSVSLSREIDLVDNGNLMARLDWSYRSRTEFGAENEPGEYQSAYSLFNTSLAWNSRDATYNVIAGVRNLTDKDFNYAYGSQSTFGPIFYIPDRGREWYLTAKYNF